MRFKENIIDIFVEIIKENIVADEERIITLR